MINKLINLFLLLFVFNTYSQVIINNEKADTLKNIKLNEVIIKSEFKKAGVYQLLIPKKVLENETLNNTIKRCSFITVDNSNNLYFKGQKIVSILYNNKPISIEEFNKLSIETTKSIQIDTNSFNQSTGDLETTLKITEKVNALNNIKGSIDFSQGFLQKFNFYSFNLSNKLGKLSSKIQVSNIINESTGNSFQRFNSLSIKSNSTRDLSQPFFLLQNTYEISEKSSISIRNRFSMIDDKINTRFTNNIINNYKFLIKNYNLNLIFEKQFSKGYFFKTNFDYINYDNQIGNTNLVSSTNSNSFQNFNEYSFSPLLQKKSKKYELINSFVLTNRNIEYLNTNAINKINQNIGTYFVNVLIKLNENNSISIGNRYTIENNNVIKKNQSYLLPSLIFSTDIDSIADIEISYKRKIQRPNIRTTSGAIITDSNGNEIVFQDFIIPQIDNQLTFDIIKEVKKVNLNLIFNYIFSNNYIANTYSFNPSNIGYTTDNIRIFNEKKVETSISFSPWKDSRLNINYSISDIRLKNFLQSFEGLINRFDFSLSGPIFKDYLFSINSFYTNRIYDFNAYTKLYPDLSSSISKNFFKNKVTFRTELRNILDQENNRSIDFQQGINSYELRNRNQSRMILFALTYNFGKTFKSPRKTIQNINNDMKSN